MRCLLFFGMALLAGCANPATDARNIDPAQEIRVTTQSDAFIETSRAMLGLCNNPAEYGRCGCYMNDVQTSCQAVISCLEAGFCTVERESQVVNVETTSWRYSELAKGLSDMCAISAEHWRCDCSIDGIAANCDAAQRCLSAGFCERVAAR